MSKKIPLEQVQAAVKRVLDKRERKEVQVDMFSMHLTQRSIDKISKALNKECELIYVNKVNIASQDKLKSMFDKKEVKRDVES